MAGPPNVTGPGKTLPLSPPLPPLDGPAKARTTTAIKVKTCNLKAASAREAYYN